ncbi:AraC family transcriptional regulator [Niabella pedocola]|uniref:AraC family transcriptional regulator n=1 Tax=Niabella pedocola TaxID=1752077 RepID=A0ABS8PLF5_9BACT|nr:AraC family transcriptional regulator [Niabella pedocola]MCD2421831.1 AraC family transcriptional regulator [Niabella pedocola]
MRSLQFSVPTAGDASIDIQEDRLPGFYPYFHRHEEIQIMWIIRGAGTLAMEQHLIEFNAGDIFYLGANQSHVFKARFNEGEPHRVHAVSVFFDPFKKLAALFNLPELEPLKAFVLHTETGFKVAPALKKTVGAALHALKAQQGFERIFSFVRVLHYLREHQQQHIFLSGSKHRTASVSDSDRRILEAKEYIRKKFTNHTLCLQEIAAQANLTPQAFCRSFKKHTGTTYIECLNELRVQEACKLLAADRLNSISSVAYNSGFNSLTNFNRVFRALIGCPPKEYLKRYRSTTAVE